MVSEMEKLAERFVHLPLQSERELKVSQVNCQNKGYTAGMPHQNCRKYSLILETYFHCCLEEAKRKREKPRFTLGIFLLLLPF